MPLWPPIDFNEVVAQAPPGAGAGVKRVGCVQAAVDRGRVGDNLKSGASGVDALRRPVE